MSQSKHKIAGTKSQPNQPRRTPLRINSEGHAEPAVTHMHHAAVHQLFIQAPIFRPIKKGTRNTAWACTGNHKRNGADASYEFSGQQMLDIFDQTVFLHLVRRAGIPPVVIPDNTHKQWPEVAGMLRMSGFTAGDKTACIFLTHSDLIRDQQRSPDERGKAAVLASLQRLASTTIKRTLYDASGKPANINSYQFIGFNERDDRTLAICLNPEAASRVEHKIGVAWVSLQEQLALKQEAAKRLHAWLSTALPKFDKKSYSVDKVIGHVWGVVPTTAARRKDAKRTLKSAMVEVAGLPGWHCALTMDGKSIEAYKPRFIGTRGRDQQSPTSPKKSATSGPISPTANRKSPTAGVASPAPGLDEQPVEPAL